jgi:hypothetical protein
MPESPLSASPYEVLGVHASASAEQLKRAFRRALRETHPDVGGDSQKFVAVQRAWDRVGTTEKRAEYDAGREVTEVTYTPREGRPRADSRPRARSHGHPGGWRRERYLVQLREWVGRGVTIDDPYDPALVRSAPTEIRHTLADALAEEATARTLSTLGIGFTVWHDVATTDPDHKIDHIVLGPTGLFAMLSEDFGAPVRVRKGELVGFDAGTDSLGGARPMHDLGERVKWLARRLRVKFTGLVMVLPDDALDAPLELLGTIRGAAAVAIRHEYLAALMRDGIAGAPAIGGNELFDLRTRLDNEVRFV